MTKEVIYGAKKRQSSKMIAQHGCQLFVYNKECHYEGLTVTAVALLLHNLTCSEIVADSPEVPSQLRLKS